MAMFAFLLTTPLLLGLGFGQDTSNVSCLSKVCPDSHCCNTLGFCGVTNGFCGYGNCSSQCPVGRSQCGPAYGNARCPDETCCSVYSWCGPGNTWCGSGNCSYQCPSGTCGQNGGTCEPASCCNTDGYCGLTDAYCGVKTCVSQCPPSSWITAPTPRSGRSFGGKSGGSKLAIIIGATVVVVAFVFVCIVIGVLVRKSRNAGRRRWGHTEEDSILDMEGMPERFSYKQLSVATKAFSAESRLGQGGFGSVYRGVLPATGMPVAVKKISSDSSQGEKEFMAEVSIISRLRHRNLIQLQGWCKDAAREKYLLVYELMPNGSLDKVLFAPAGSQTPFLTWPQRFNIVMGTAAAVEYLHRGWKQQVIHRDIKSSNIMLDGNWNAKLGDFGLARLVDHQRAGPTTLVAGTYGYIAPEAAYSGRFTDKTDVFAFGAVVLEIACGRRALSSDLPPEEVILMDWVWERLSVGELLTTVDKRLEEYDTHMMELVLVVGLLCSHPDPHARPSMRHVVQILAGEVPVPTIPASKPAPVYRSDSGNVSIEFLRALKSGNASKAGSTAKSGRTYKSWGSSKSWSGSISMVSTSTFDSIRGFTPKLDSKPSFPAPIHLR